MRRTVLLAIIALTISGPAESQDRFRKVLPSDETAHRYGLVRAWYGFAPVDGVREKVDQVSIVGDEVHLQTNSSRIHVLDGKTGRLLWSAQMGMPAPGQFGSAINSSSVFVINGSRLYRLNREDGSQIWSQKLPQAANAAPAADEERVMVSTADGRLYAYNQDTHKPIWYYQTNAPVALPAVFLDEKIACASQDGIVYVFQVLRPEPTLRYMTDAPISAPLETWGRTVLVASHDYNAYSVDVRTGKTMWRYSAGAPILRPLTVIENDLYLAPEELGLHALNVETGEVKWSTRRAQDFVCASTKRLYAVDRLGQLLIFDRNTGRLVTQWDTRHFDFRVRNTSNDRLYLATANGLVVCLHEPGNDQPVEHKKVEPLAPDPGAMPGDAIGP